MRYTYSTTTVADDWLFTPGLDLTGGVSYQLNYLLGHNAGTSYTEKVRVMYGTSPMVAAMTELSIRGIDLTRIESRPTRTELGTYKFFLDCVGHIADEAVGEALKALHRRCAEVRYLGSWPTGAAVGALPPEVDEATRWLQARRTGGSA